MRWHGLTRESIQQTPATEPGTTTNTESTMPTIKALRVENFKAVRAVDIEPDGRQIVILGGDNAAGKTSVLDAIAGALAGKKALPSEPVHRGEDRGCVVIELDDGITIRRTLTRKEDGSTGGTLKVSTADGMSPSGGAQKWLDRRIGAMTVDPLAFLHKDDKAQAEQLRQVAGIDTTDIDATIKELRADRTLKGREVKRAKGAAEVAPRYADAPDVAPVPAVVSASAIVAKVDAAVATVQASEEAARTLQAARDAVARGEEAVAGLDQEMAVIEEEIARLMAKIEAIKGKRSTYVAALDVRKAAVVEAENAAITAAAAVVDPTPFRLQLNALEATNAAARKEAAQVAEQVKANARADALQADADALQAEYDALSAAIATAEQDRATLIASAALPVDGLGLSDDGVVLFGGLPFSQASQAQKMRVSLAIALAGTDENGIRVALIRDASLLDDKSMQLVAELAAEMNAQVWLERVGSGDDGAVVIVDGSNL